MPVIKFTTDPNQSPFFKDIIKKGYHVFSLKKAKKSNFYPNEFPEYSGVSLKDLKVGETITVRCFFRVGTGDDIRADGGYIDLEVEDVFIDGVTAVILTELPKEFPLVAGDSIDVLEEEILYKNKVTDN